jgi:NDP-sugar pyrophosphorylase family protein
VNPISTAFVLGAGLGTRLRPLTEDQPKPLLHVGGRPMITYAFDQVIDAGARRIIVNTHHAAARYAEAFPDSTYKSIPLTFRHEPELLDTAGGLKNIEDLLAPGEPLIVYNGDIVATLPLAPLVATHRAIPAPATLALRRQGQPCNVALHADGRITDFRHTRGAPDPLHLFTGIYIVEPSVLELIPEGRPVSIIDVFLNLIREGRPPRGVVIDEGRWHDLGSLDDYHQLAPQPFP